MGCRSEEEILHKDVFAALQEAAAARRRQLQAKLELKKYGPTLSSCNFNLIHKRRNMVHTSPGPPLSVRPDHIDPQQLWQIRNVIEVARMCLLNWTVEGTM